MRWEVRWSSTDDRHREGDVENIEAWQDGSAREGAHFQAWWPEFNPQDTLGWWEERANYCKVSTDLHRCAAAHTAPTSIVLNVIVSNRKIQWGEPRLNRIIFLWSHEILVSQVLIPSEHRDGVLNGSFLKKIKHNKVILKWWIKFSPEFRKYQIAIENVWIQLCEHLLTILSSYFAGGKCQQPGLLLQHNKPPNR